MEGLEKLWREVLLELAELPAVTSCGRCGYGGRLFVDMAVTWEELEESLSVEGDLWCCC